ncbi:membrane protein containing Diguanylate phosphodiesterase, predicted [Candidatus Magnetomorum sp. HK-1]|nr:membrane protein containing Diguanylate phosphodiesterase, predicted [Candidatus Magnetomorum sp. HK-1]
MKFSKHLILFFVLSILGILGNVFNVEMFFGVNQIFGSIFVLIAVWLFGLPIGVLCAIVVHSYTIVLWGHPYAFISFVFEACFVAFLLKKRTSNIFIADIIYWLFIGVPLVYIFYGLVMEMSQTQVINIMLKQPVNALFNALVAELLVYYLPIEKIYLGYEKHKIKFKYLILNIIMAFTFFSLFLAVNMIASHVFDKNFANIQKDLVWFSKQVSNDIDLFQDQLNQSMSIYHKLYKQRGKKVLLDKDSPFENIYSRHKNEKNYQLIAHKDLKPNQSFPFHLIPTNLKNTIQIMPSDPNRFFIFTHKNSYFYAGIQKIEFLNKVLNFNLSKDSYQNIIVHENDIDIGDNAKKRIYENRSLHLKGEKHCFQDDLYILFPENQSLPKMLKWKKAHLVIEVPCVGKGFHVAIKKSLLPMMNNIRQLYIYIFAFMLILIGIALILSSWVSSRLELSIHKISKETSNLPDKLLNHKQPVWPDSKIREIDSLVQNFKSVSKTLYYIFQESENRYNQLFANTTDALFVVDPQTFDIIDANQQAEMLTGISHKKLINTSIGGLFDDFVFKQNSLKDSLEDFRSHIISQDTKIPVQVRIHPMRSLQNDVYFFVVKNIQDSIKMQEQLQLGAKVFETTHEGILITDNKKNILMVNKAFEDITGYKAEDVVGKDPKVISSGWHDRTFYQNMWQSIYKEGSWQGEISDRRKNGEIYTQLLSIYAVKDKNDKLTNYIGIFMDITEKKEAQKRIKKLANFDSLTDLPNLTSLLTNLTNAISVGHQNDLTLGLLIIDMDNFKAINDSFGYKTGDVLLKKIVSRVKSETKDVGIMNRVGADVFALIFEKVKQTEDLAYCSKKILNTFDQPFIVDNEEVYLSASIGICLYPDDAQTAEEMLQFADIAMHRAKDLGKKRFEFYTQAQNESTRKKISIESGLRTAIQRNELFLYYQPQVDILSGKLIGCEALLRWIHPEKGFIPPDIFIPIAEDSGLIGDIEKWVLKTSAKQIKKWKDRGLDLIMSVNISNYQFGKKNFVDITKSLIEGEQAKCEWFELELTERIVMDHNEVIEKLEKLKELGFMLALDDFGTGYSSLAYLKKFNIDKLKIDKSFIQDLPEDNQSCDIVRAIISLANALKMSIIAEGAETKEQLDFLADLKCEAYQGYYYSKPVPVDEFEKFFNKI